MPKLISFACLTLALACLAGCSDTPIEENSGDSTTEASNPETKSSATSTDAPAESALLKQELLEVTAEIMKTQKPDATANELQGQVDGAIAAMRKHYPEFLMVSAETEKMLAAGTPPADAAVRITAAEELLQEYGLQTSILVETLLPQHKAGKPTAVRTELLAQLMTAEMKTAQHALSN